jgi:hypothetical protein
LLEEIGKKIRTTDWTYLYTQDYRRRAIAVYQVDHWFGARVVFDGSVYETEADLEEFVIDRCKQVIDQSFPQPAREIDADDIPF